MGASAYNYVEGDGWDNFFRLKFKYLLPIGAGRDKVIETYKIREGVLESGSIGGTSLNPFKSGYPSQRVNDRAAVYYSAKLRLIPKWNPFDG